MNRISFCCDLCGYGFTDEYPGSEEDFDRDYAHARVQSECPDCGGLDSPDSWAFHAGLPPCEVTGTDNVHGGDPRLEKTS